MFQKFDDYVPDNAGLNLQGCLFRTMGLNLFHRTLMRLRSVETADDICPLLPE